MTQQEFNQSVQRDIQALMAPAADDPSKEKARAVIARLKSLIDGFEDYDNPDAETLDEPTELGGDLMVKHQGATFRIEVKEIRHALYVTRTINLETLSEHDAIIDQVVGRERAGAGSDGIDRDVDYLLDGPKTQAEIEALRDELRERLGDPDLVVEYSGFENDELVTELYAD